MSRDVQFWQGFLEPEAAFDCGQTDRGYLLTDSKAVVYSEPVFTSADVAAGLGDNSRFKLLLGS